MVRILCITSLALAAVSAVSGHVIRHRRGAPQGWQSSILQSYPEYHDRYLLWDCQNKHNSSFFEKCCHPLLGHESLDVLTDAGCDSDCDDGESPVTSSVSSSSPLPTPTTPAPKAALSNPSPSPTTSSAKFRNVDASHAPAAAPVTPATTSTHEPAPSPSPTTSKNNGNSGSGSGSPNTGGQATFFYQEGAAGACGQVHQDSDFICAMDQDRYGNAGNASPLCGKQVIITNTQNGKSVTVTVADDCPTCENSNSIDLSVAAFNAIADESQGVVPISWVFGN